MITVGLTGGVATGKSMVARFFAREGAHVIDSDEIAHKAIAPRTSAWREIVNCFGKEVLNPNGTINRPLLGRMVFSNSQKRRLLESIIHPHVFSEQDKRKKAIRTVDPHAVIIMDIPLLIETRGHLRVDKVIVVSADRKTQLKRLMERNRLSRAEALSRVRSQMPLSRKKRYADYLIDGRRPLTEVKKEVRRIYLELRGLA